MEHASYFVLGVMSGTSVDGIDLAFIRFEKRDSWSFEILFAKTHAYTLEWQVKLREAINCRRDQLKDLDGEYTAYLGKVISDFIKENNIEKIDAICSHGHTILHQPHNGITYQIGNTKQLAYITGNRVICDFRVQDVAYGGQGAPLVPIGDRFLFAEYDFCLNIGGFANISFEDNGERLAYDICPTNIVLNHYAEKLGQAFDENGKIAASNSVNKELLKKLNNLPFYSQPYPKSLGLEWVIEIIFPLLNSSGLPPEEVIATFTEHMAQQITLSFSAFQKPDPSVLVTGGGAFNKHLIRRINDLCNGKLIVPDKKIIEFKEALIFGFMGVLRLRNTNNVLKSVTGASRNHCSGVVFNP